MIEVDEPLSFEAFEKIPEYHRVNQEFVEKIPIQNHQTIVEVASGRGKVTGLLLEKAPEAKIICIEPEFNPLVAAKKKFARPNVYFVQGRVEDLAQILAQEVDGVVIGNAIHNFSEKQKAIEAVYEVLKPGGFFAFNSAFSQEGKPESEQRFYRTWMMYVIREFKEISKVNPEIIFKGERPEVRKPLSLDEYCELLEEVGFKIIIDENDRVVPVILGLNAFQAISTDPDFISGALLKLNTEKEEYLRIGSQILKKAAASAFASFASKKNSVRVWIQLIAQKF